jgi:phi LC3 family holin
MYQSRFKSPVVWGAIIAQVLSILVALGVLLPDASEAVNAVVSSVLQMLVVFGVLNDPSNKTDF